MDESWFKKTQDRTKLFCISVADQPPPLLGQGPCSFPNCSASFGGNPCTGYTGTANDCLNCGHTWNYHA